MKNFLIAIMFTAVALPSFSRAENVLVNCGPMKSEDGNILVGAQYAVVSMTNFLSGTKELFVRTGAVVPNPLFTYELLTRSFMGIDASQYKSAHYNFSLVYLGGGLRGFLETHDGKLSGICLSPKDQP